VKQVAVLLHGAGSCPETAVRLLGDAVPEGVTVRAPAWRGSVADAVIALDLEAAGTEPVLVAGLSLGAHAAARWAAGTGARVPLLLAMPAWTGVPGEVAALTSAAADDLAARGVAAVLAALAADPVTSHDWVLDELARGWATYDEVGLVDALRAAASSAGPSLEDLSRIQAPAAVVALDDDPLHPRGVAEQWASAIDGARLTVVGRHQPLTDRGVLGRAGSRELLGLNGSR
jgi:pimeloyl-ACP methyl ester carboxylesterase